ncbi:hypothetical protein AK812_SmicGene30716 [Symbiodinium microadriaticum]|uniref:Uncharacterized protein n=1 Tax=Symbiodinium microadriaticum TaxID=2951 RepID=A0A1Q9CYL3_SYMMI|nr:hypothetical protein AK812_SmicGene30716 [Symbiodinium microadriaticum]
MKEGARAGRRHEELASFASAVSRFTPGGERRRAAPLLMGVARKRFCQAALEVCFGQLEEITPFARTLLGCTACGCCLCLTSAIAFGGFLDLTLQGLREQWQEAECQVLGPGRITTLATTCEEFDTGSSCSRLGEYRDVVSSVFLRYCRRADDGGLCFDAQADRCGSGSPIDLQEDRRLQLLTQNRSRIPCWYNRLEDQTEDARDEEATEAFCTAANTSTCSFQKTSQARYTLRLEAEPCTPQPVKGSIGMSVFLGGLLLGFLACGLACALRARRELLTDYEDEFTEH